MPGEEVVGVAEPVLPATVVTAHLATCARAIADAEPAVADLQETAGHLVGAQRDISSALTRLAARVAPGLQSSTGLCKLRDPSASRLHGRALHLRP